MLIVATVAATTLAVALLGGLVAFSPKLSEHLLAWSLLNLFITYVAEEVVFRGFIRRKAQRWFEAKQWPSIFVEPLVGSHPATFCLCGARGRIMKYVLYFTLQTTQSRASAFKNAPSIFVEPLVGSHPATFCAHTKTPSIAAGRFCLCGARGRIRTSDRLVRSQILYPAELHVHYRGRFADFWRLFIHLFMH